MSLGAFDGGAGPDRCACRGSSPVGMWANDAILLPHARAPSARQGMRVLAYGALPVGAPADGCTGIPDGRNAAFSVAAEITTKPHPGPHAHTDRAARRGVPGAALTGGYRATGSAAVAELARRLARERATEPVA